MAIVRRFCASLAPEYTREQQLDLAYLAFYYGVGPNSTRVLLNAVQHHRKDLVEAVIAELKRVQEMYRDLFDRGTSNALEWARTPYGRFPYVPFDGHQSRLGHYFRLLYQTMKYVAAHAKAHPADEYAGIVRAQLTNHEQALLCLNAMSRVGKAWLDTDLLTKYSMIKNIPLGFFDPETEIDLKSRFPTIRFESEGQEEVPEPKPLEPLPVQH